MTTLAVLIAELQSEVPAVNSVPTTAQYTQAIKDAAAEFSRRCGLKKNTTLSIVAGTASYALPADFLKLIELDNPYDPEHRVIVTATGIIPFSELAPFEEEVTIANKTLTIFPTPGYTMVRYLEYKASWVLSGTTGAETFADMGEDEAQIVLLKAKSIAMEKIANAMASSGGMKYSLGAVSVDKSTGTDTLTNKVYKWHGDFVDACDRYNGAVLL
jgi:hypothetical protein